MSRLSKSIDRARSLLKASSAVVNMGGKKVLSSSPKATGEAGRFSLGKTSGGKSISSYSHREPNSGWSSRDHLDAYHAHFKHVTDLSQDSTVHKNLIAHHKAAMQHHWLASNGNVKKSMLAKGGGSSIGKTRSGKRVHSHHSHPSHADFTSEDHADAANLHHAKAMKTMDQMMKTKGSLHKLLGKRLKHHGEHAIHHHHKAHGGHHG